MGIRYLEKFIRTEVPDGCKPVNIANDIRKSSSRSPIIVIHFHSLYQPISDADLNGVLCGGRFEYAYQIMEKFLSRLYSLGATLVFFDKSPPVGKCTDSESWIRKQNEKYELQLHIFDAIDRDEDLRMVVARNKRNIPINTQYQLKMLARRYGTFKIASEKKCNKEIAAYASNVQALAIISNNTDYLIYNGNWRFWSAKDLHFGRLTTIEFNRPALLSCLGLNRKQMPLFATLGGNDIILYDEVLPLHSRMGNNPIQKFFGLANLVRGTTDNILTNVFGKNANEDLRERFQASLESYDTNKIKEESSSSDDPTYNFLLEQGRKFMLKIWNNFPMHVSGLLLDFRDIGLGSEYPSLAAKIILREAAVILYHRKEHPDCTVRQLVLKRSHNESYAEQSFPIVFPQHIEVPPLLDMLSSNPELRPQLLKTKFQLYCWIISDKLSSDLLAKMPPKLVPTILTLYYLMEHQILKLFEADLILQVAYDVVFNKYDIFEKRYPHRLNKRAFHVALFYIAINKHVSKALKVVGLDKEGYADYPQFDGMRFHSMYQQWEKSGGDINQIMQWRIYQNIEEEKLQ